MRPRLPPTKKPTASASDSSFDCDFRRRPRVLRCRFDGATPSGRQIHRVPLLSSAVPASELQSVDRSRTIVPGPCTFRCRLLVSCHRRPTALSEQERAASTGMDYANGAAGTSRPTAVHPADQRALQDSQPPRRHASDLRRLVQLHLRTRIAKGQERSSGERNSRYGVDGQAAARTRGSSVNACYNAGMKDTAPKQRWIRSGLLIVAGILIVADFIRCETNPKLRASDAFAGDMIFAAFFLAIGLAVWGVGAAVRKLFFPTT